MSLFQRFATAIIFILILAGLGTTDALLTSDMQWIPQDGNSSSSAQPLGIEKQNGPDVFDVLNKEGIATENTDEQSILHDIVPEGTPTEARTLLMNNDRLAYFSWTESPDVKVYFSALKEALRTSFSSHMQDLVDENQVREGKPLRNVLSFKDPAIHEERLLFIRVRQRMYEFHVPEGKEGEVQRLMDSLTE
jgi:hypothetical protein